METTNPGAAVRFVGRGTLKVHLEYTALVTRLDTYNDVGCVMVDGVEFSVFDSPGGQGTPARLDVDVFLGDQPQAVAVLMPYCASIDFLGVTGEIGPRAASAPSKRYVAIGDSITQGFSAIRTTRSWPYMAALKNGWQIVNHGYGGRRCVPTDGTAAAGLAPEVMTYLIGYNDFSAQVPPATFQSNVAAFIANVRAVSNAPLYCITPLSCTNEGTAALEVYRQAIRNAVLASRDPLTRLIEGPLLLPAEDRLLKDGVHPNEIGCSMIADRLAPLLAQSGI